MIDMRFKPSWLPQMNAPISYVLGKLKDDGIKCQLININPANLKPSQGIIFSDKVSDIDSSNLSPIWSSKDDYVLDGHHRYGSSLSASAPYLKSIKVDLNRDDAARALNKIMDIYEHENSKVDEVVAQDQINQMNDPRVDPANFLEMLEGEKEEEITDQNVVGAGQKKKIKGYRKEEAKENSGVGNFFSLKAIKGYKKYEIEFDNLLDTNSMELIYHANKNPTLILAKNWFPNIKFDNIAKKHGVDPTILMNRAIAEKAIKMGYDGIKYGDIMIQAFK